MFSFISFSISFSGDGYLGWCFYFFEIKREIESDDQIEINKTKISYSIIRIVVDQGD